MAGLNKYNNIPGMPLDFRNDDTNSNIGTNYAATKSMLILGTAEDGPVLEPVAVDPNTIKVFGKSSRGNGIPNNATLVKDFEHAWGIGCRDIRVMRVTGKEASYTLRTAESEAVDVKKIEEAKGIVGGNDETVLTLVNTPLENTLKVYSKGILISKGYTLTGKTLTLGKNCCDAGAMISVMYSYHPEVKADEIVSVIGSESKTATLKNTPKGEIEVTNSNHEVLVKTTDYTVSGKVITFVTDKATDKVNVKYTYTSTNPANISENNNNGETYVAKYTNKTISITNEPVDKSVRMYIANKEVSNKDAYTVNGKNIEINKKYFSKNDDIVVSYLYEESMSTFSTIKLESAYGGEIYNQSKIVIETIEDREENYFDKVIKITKPENKKLTSTEEPLTYKASEYPTFLALTNAINSDRYNNVFKVSTDYPEAMTVELQDVDTYLSGGDNGLNATKQDMYEALAGTRDEEGYIEKQGAFQILENYSVDVVVPGGVYADDNIAGRHKDFAYELALLCAIITNRSKTVLGVIPTKPCTDTSLIGVQKHTNKLLSYQNTYPMRDENANLILDSEGQPIDLGRYIHVVIGPEPLVLNSELGVVIGNPAIQYAAELTMLPAQSSPLNKNLHGMKNLRYTYQTGQIDKLLENRYTIFNTKINKATKVNYKMVDGLTCAFPGSQYGKTTTLRCLQEIIDEFRDAAEPFFGEPPSVQNRNALASAISKRKEALINQGVAEDIAFQLIVTAQDYLLGQATLEVDVVPPKEFRKINMVVGLKNTI